VAIKLTAKAAGELKTLLQKEIEASNLKPGAALRLMVVGGGCSGFSYRMGFDEDIKEHDRVEDIDGVKVVVDQKSYLYLEGTEVDYHDSLMGRGFVFNNPNASGTCGCGSSFSV
jgi:iron-sulfur cluster assembly protein